MLQEEDPTKYEAHFAKYIEAGIDAEKMEDHLLVSDALSSRLVCDVFSRTCTQRLTKRSVRIQMVRRRRRRTETQWSGGVTPVTTRVPGNLLCAGYYL